MHLHEELQHCSWLASSYMFISQDTCGKCVWIYFRNDSLSCVCTPWNQVFPLLTDLLFVFPSCLDLFQPPSLWEDVSSPHAAVPEDAWCHLVYLIITLPALLHNAALSPHRHLKCLAGLFSETIMKLCAKTPQTLPPLFSLQPCVPGARKRFLHCCSVKGKTNKANPLAVCLRSLVQILLHFCKLQSPILQHNYNSLILQREKKSVELTLCMKRFSHCLAFNSVFVTWSISESLNDCFTHYLNNNNKKYMYATLIYCYNSAIYRLMPQPVILF